MSISILIVHTCDSFMLGKNDFVDAPTVNFSAFFVLYDWLIDWFYLHKRETRKSCNSLSWMESN